MCRNLAQNIGEKELIKQNGFNSKHYTNGVSCKKFSTTLLADNFIKPFTRTLINQALKDKDIV